MSSVLDDLYIFVIVHATYMTFNCFNLEFNLRSSFVQQISVIGELAIS